MAIEIKAPQFPESVADGTVATWHKQPGDAVTRDELLVDIETDKVVLEVVAPSDGVLLEINKGEGETVLSLEVLASIDEGAVASPAGDKPTAAAPEMADAATEALSPAVRKIIAENDLNAADIKGSGKGGRITKEDVVNHMKQGPAVSVAPAVTKPQQSTSPTTSQPSIPVASGEREEKRVPMTRMRKTTADRLLTATQSTAMLTTFNEVNMEPIMSMRKNYQEAFVKAHDIKLGFMSFFLKAAVEALKRYPGVNASLDGTDIVYHGYYDVSVAVSSESGLTTPVLRDVDARSFAEIESQLVEYGMKAKNRKLTIDDLTGGTFTISNGGVFGSLLSTPILNLPQTAVLGMHKIQDRPMAINGEVVILPMMYLALSYDHRLIDGKEAVGFLVTIKEFLEDPARLLLDL